MPPQRQGTFPAAANIVTLSVDAVQFVAQFAGVPALAPALGVVRNIIQACVNMESNKSEAQQLQERCRFLILALRDYHSQDVKGSEIGQVIDGCTAQLYEVYDVVSKHARLKRWQSFLNLNQISADFLACHIKIDDCCRKFQIRSSIQLHQWHDENKRAREEDKEELLQLLATFKEDNDQLRQAVTDIGGQVRQVLDLLQTQLGGCAKDSREYHDLKLGLYNVQKRSGELPPCIDLKAGEARRIGKFPVAGNAAFDIWEGEWLGCEKVALKTIRGVHVSPETRKRFNREVSIWRDVWFIDRGRYILPFYGACFQDGPYPYMVSPWMNNGDVLHYLSRYPSANRRDIIKGIANGLSFLHNLSPNPIAHGDVKGANVLIDDSGHPLLADFGLSKILEDITGVPFTQSKGVSDSYRWFAPELCSSAGVISTFSDVFAYGMTVVEIFTGLPPFQHIKRTTEVLIEMQKGERPRKPTEPEVIERGLDDRLWTVVTTCWEGDPERRPSIDEVLAQLNEYADGCYSMHETSENGGPCAIANKCLGDRCSL